VNGRDVFTWLRNFTGPGAVAAAQVPEPASLLLLTLAAALLPRRMR
jgi:hypothetical protein